MIPIGILTRDRLPCLAATLYSLAGTDLPADVEITIFDDGSESQEMAAFRDGTAPVPVPGGRLQHQIRESLGLSVLKKVPATIPALPQTALRLVAHPESLGVFRGSCRALQSLAATYPAAEGCLLLQDDVVFNKNWFQRLVGAARAYQAKRPLGLLAGIRLNRVLPKVSTAVTNLQKVKTRVFPSYATGQCLYFPQATLHALLPWLAQEERGERRSKWDDAVCETVDKVLNRDVGLLYPFCCQHIGVKSLVRPRRHWKQFGESGRIGHYAYPPYAMSSHLAFGPKP